MGHTVNSIVINAPYELVFDISNKIERYPVKKMKITFFVFLLLFILTADSVQAQKNPGKRWSSCVKDSDCIIVMGPCGNDPHSINKIFKSKAIRYYIASNPLKICNKMAWIPSPAVCVENKCVFGKPFKRY